MNLFPLDICPKQHIQDIVKKYHYRKLPKQLSELSQDLYLRTLPEWCQLNGDSSATLITSSGIVVCNGYKRIVVGDYGAFIEFTREQAVKHNICCAKGERYRFSDPSYSDKVKYYHYTTKDESDVKIYFQQKTVTYADYLPNNLYICPFEVKKID